MADEIRYSRVTDILHLLYMMMSEPKGISLEEICEEFGVSRRTAERMRNAVAEEFNAIDVINEDEKIKRWGFVHKYSMKEIVTFSDREIAAMEVVKQNFRNRDVLPEINTIIDKMKILKERKYI